MRPAQTPAGVMAISRDQEAFLRALDELQRHGFSQVRTFSPLANSRLMARVESQPSPVRVYALLGGLAGFLAGSP